MAKQVDGVYDATRARTPTRCSSTASTYAEVLERA